MSESWLNLEGKTVIVTGGASGIGKAVAQGFLNAGSNVVISDMAPEAPEMDEAAGKLLYVKTDVTKVADVEAMVEKAKETFGTIDVLVNNAGVSHIGLFMDMQPDEWKRVVDINLNSVMNCTHIVLPYMLRQHSGVIINISSMWGEKGASCEAVYSATKGGINAFTKAMAKEMGPSGIRVNAISCGVIDTKMNDCFSPEEKAMLCDEISLMRFGKPSEVAKLAAFLADENESGYISGQVISIDGAIV